jgi:hypothetical protein
MRHKTKWAIALLAGSWVALQVGAKLCAGASPQTQDLKGEVVDEKGQAIAGASCTLTGLPLADRSIPVATGEKGEFAFPGLLPGAYDLTCAALEHEPVMQKGIEVAETAAPFLQVTLPAEIRLHEKVEIRGVAPTISQQSSAPPATLSAQQLRTLPLTQQKFQAALPLVPGVVRTPDGRINIKGVVENQGMLLVDAAETVDPVTGSFSIDVPIDAVESVEVYKTAYRAEYGRFSGGLTSIQTKPPSGKWNYELNDFVPTPRIKGGHLVGISDNKPRLSFTGPLWTNKLNFSESFTYDLLKQPVRGLAYPHNEVKTQGFDSFTNFQYIISARHLLTANVNVFPLRRQFANINSFIPQSASSDYGQRGFSLGATDRYLLASGSVITTLVKYTDFRSNARGQGPENMFLKPDGWGGNFFNSWERSSQQQEVLQTFQLPRKEWLGRHELKFGGDFVHRAYDGNSRSHPVQILRPDGSLAGRIAFSGPASLSTEDTELAVFFQDHWAFNDQLALDYGLRFSGQTIGEKAALAPRLGLVYSPGKDGKTIIRSGVGIFYDRLPLLAGDFIQNPRRSVTFFDNAGVPLGPTMTFRNAYERVDENQGIVIPSAHHLDSTPYNITWNLEADREIQPHVVVRLSYLSSRTYDAFYVNPMPLRPNDPVLLLTNTGGSRYHEFESTLRVRPAENADINFSYVRSRARGDLNTLTSVFVPFEQPVIRPNFFADLPSNIPHRLVTWGQFRIPWAVTISPLLDVHSGFPYSAVDVVQNYAGQPNSRRFPTFASLDLKLAKDFRVRFLPWLSKHKFRGAFQIFNLTNLFNPRDVYNNIASPLFGRFVGLQHRFYDASIDIVY